MTPEEAFAQLKGDAAWPLRPTLTVPDRVPSRRRRAGIAWRVGLGAAVSAAAVAALVGVLVVRGTPLATQWGLAQQPACDPADVRVDDVVLGDESVSVDVSAGRDCALALDRLHLTLDGGNLLAGLDTSGTIGLREQPAVLSVSTHLTGSCLNPGPGGMATDRTVRMVIDRTEVDARVLYGKALVFECPRTLSVTPPSDDAQDGAVPQLTATQVQTLADHGIELYTEGAAGDPAADSLDAIVRGAQMRAPDNATLAYVTVTGHEGPNAHVDGVPGRGAQHQLAWVLYSTRELEEMVGPPGKYAPTTPPPTRRTYTAQEITILDASTAESILGLQF